MSKKKLLQDDVTYCKKIEKEGVKRSGAIGER